MANGLRSLAGLCALYLLCTSCGADSHPDPSSTAGTSATSSAGGPPTAEHAGAAGSSASGGGVAEDGGAGASGGTAHSVGGGGAAAGATNGPPPAVDGQSVYRLACHGDSKDCNLAAVPCLGVSGPTANVAAGWACANRCASNADCSDAPSGAEAQARCVPFSSAGHCLLVCQDENRSFACPNGMSCYVPPKSPTGYCLWP